MDKFVFVHLPKTAGTSLREGLLRVVGRETVSAPFNASFLSVDDARALDAYDFIFGHVSLSDVRTYFPKRHILTVLRDPVERCLSWYYFARTTPKTETPSDVREAQTHTVEEFFALDVPRIHRNIYNRQVRQLSGHVLDTELDMADALSQAKVTLQTAAWVGRQEFLAEDLRRLAQAFPVFAAVSLEPANVTAVRKGRSDLSARVIDRIIALNEYDIQLYDHACAMFGPS